MKINDEVYIHTGGYKHKRALVVSLLPKMMNVRLLHGRKTGKIVRINQSSAVVVEAQYRTPEINGTEAQHVREFPPPMGTNRSPVSFIAGNDMAVQGNSSGANTIEELPVDSIQKERENVATPTELMRMMQEEMDEVQMTATVLMQRMNHIRQLMEKIQLEPHE